MLDWQTRFEIQPWRETGEGGAYNDRIFPPKPEKKWISSSNCKHTLTQKTTTKKKTKKKKTKKQKARRLELSGEIERNLLAGHVDQKSK